MLPAAVFSRGTSITFSTAGQYFPYPGLGKKIMKTYGENLDITVFNTAA